MVPGLIALDRVGNVYVTGDTSNSDWVGPPPMYSTPDVFTLRLRSDGTDDDWLEFLSGSAFDYANGIALDPDGNVVIVGSTTSTDLPVPGAFDSSHNGNSDVYLARYANLPPPALTGISTDSGSSSTDFLTTDQTLTLSGTAPNNATVKIYRADTGYVGQATANGSGAWSYDYSGVTLGEGTYAFTFTTTLSGSTGWESKPYLVTVDLTAPTVALDLVDTTYDLTPRILVTAGEFLGLPSSATVTLDVDLNNDSDFADAGEAGYDTDTLTDGFALFDLAPALSLGTVRVRARVTDRAGNEGTSNTETLVLASSGSAWTTTDVTQAVDPLQGDALLQRGALVLRHELDLDKSPGTGVGLSPALVYSSDRVNVQPVITAQVQADNGTALPGTITAQLTFNGVTQTAQVFSTTGRTGGELLTVAQQVNSPVLTTGYYSYRMTVTLDYGSPITRSIAGNLPVVAEDSSVYGAGWTLGGVDRLYTVTGGILREYGSGGHSYYAQSGGSYTSPAGDNGTLAASGSDYTYTLPDGWVWTFNSAGLQTKWSSADGKALVSWTYDGSNNLTKVQTPDGAVTTVNYASGKVSNFETGSRLTTLTQSGGDLTVIRNPDGGLHSYTYSSHRVTREDFASLRNDYAYTNGALSSFTPGDQGAFTLTPASQAGLSSLAAAVLATLSNPLGQATRWELDASGRTTKQYNPDGGITTLTRDAQGRVTGVDDPLGRHTTITRDSAGYVNTITHADGRTQEYQYQTPYHALTSYKDERGGRWTMTYDGLGHQESVKDPLGNLTTNTYHSSSGLLESTKDPLGRLTIYLYDSSRRLETRINAAGDRYTLTYDSNGNAATETDELGRVTSYTNDALGRVTRVDRPLNLSWTNTYDGAGQLTSSTAPQSGRSDYTYNKSGLLTRQVEAAGSPVQRSTLQTFNLAGQQTAGRNPSGISRLFGYDANGRPLTTTDALTNGTRSGYDLAGQQTRTRDELGRSSDTVYNSRGWVTKMTDALGNVTTVIYDEAGNVTGRIDALGNRTSIVYDSLNRETSRTEAVGVSGVERTLTIVYDAVGNVVQRIDGLGRVTSTGYDALNRVLTVTEAVGTADERLMSYAYDKVGNQTSSTDWRGYRSDRAYDALNRLTTLTQAANGTADEQRTSTFAYDSATGHLTDQTDPLGRRGTMVYDKLGRQTGESVGIYSVQTASRTSRLLDAEGRAYSSTDPLGKAWLSTVDVLGRSGFQIDPLGNKSRSLHDAAGSARVSVDALGYRSDYRPDALGRTVESTNALGNVTSTVYDAVGNVLAVVNARGYRTSYTYDALNRRTEEKNALGHIVTTTFDRADNVTKVTDQLGKVTTSVYDSLNRRTSVQNPGGGIYTSVYDDSGNVTTEINPLGHRTTHLYDAHNQRIKTTDAITGVLTQMYDKQGNRTGLIDPQGNRTTWTYDAQNRMTEEIDPFNKALTTNYDVAGRVSSHVDRLGRRREYTYDAAGRRTQEVWKNAGGTQVNTLTWSHDSSGNVLTASDSNGTYTLTYDTLHRVSKVNALFGVTFTFTYDSVGNRTKVEDSKGGLTTSTYDALNRLTRREFTGNSGTLQWDTAYTVRNQVSTITRYSDLGTTKIGDSQYSYDDAGRLENLKHRNGAGTTLENYTYVYDTHSRVLSETLNGTATNYGYDSTDQLTSAGTYTYDYDLNGNRDSAGYVTSTGNRMTNDGTFTYTYDDEGNVTKKSMGASAETWTYGYDNRNQMTTVEKRATDGGTLLMKATYSYDVWGNRVQKQVWDGTTTTTERFVQEGWKRPVDNWGNPYPLKGLENFDIAMDLDGSNNLVMRRLFGDGVDTVSARVSSAGVAAWYLPDYQGSVQNIVDGSGALINTITYEAFGKVISESSPANGDVFGYTGRTHDDETGNIYLRYNYVDPVTGHRYDTDPMFPESGPNPYAHVGNNPTNATDPSGFQGDYKAVIRIGIFDEKKEKVGEIAMRALPFGNNIQGQFETEPLKTKQGQTRLQRAAELLGVHHFNWFQVIVKDADPNLGADLELLAVPYIDLPPLGYRGTGIGGKVVAARWADRRPWYLNEEEPSKKLLEGWKARGIRDEAKGNYRTVENSTRTEELQFDDEPNNIRANTLIFRTWLVGVDKDGNFIKWFSGFEWGWTNIGNDGKKMERGRMLGVKELNGPPPRAYIDLIKSMNFVDDKLNP